MGAFICGECGCVDNTALGDYWMRVHLHSEPPLCSECAYGEWHGRFPKEPWEHGRTVLNPPEGGE